MALMGVEAVHTRLRRAGVTGVTAHEWRQSIRLEGMVPAWRDFVAAGYAAAGQGYRGVVNDVRVKGIEPQPLPVPRRLDDALEGRGFDAVIIGGGIIGCMLARELRRFDIAVALLEKEDDVGRGASGRNNGIIHPCLAATPGTRKAAYNARGNRMYRELSSELGFKLDWSGAIYLFPRHWYGALYPLAYRRARRNGEEHLRLLGRAGVFRLEPHAWPAQQGGILLPDSGVVAPDQVTIACADNAVQNGARIFLNTAVIGLDVEGGRITGVRTNRGRLRGRVVINAAGVWADRVAELADDRFYTIHPRKGVMAITDRSTGDLQRRSLGMMWIRRPGRTKGGGVSRTIEGNLLLGPTADEVPDREDHGTSCEELEALLHRHMPLNAQLRPDQIIAYFAGVRAVTFEEDFVVEESRRVANLIHVAGIQSPGLTAAPAIAEDVRDLVVAMLRREVQVRARPEFDPCRKSPPSLSGLTLEERHRLILRNPAYGRIVCRCEEVSEGEVVAAIGSPLPATTVSAVKHRTRTGMGRCQGGFCTPSVLKLIAREMAVPATRVTWQGGDSLMLAGETGE